MLVILGTSKMKKLIRTLHVKGVERGLEMVLAVFPSAQFPGKQVLKMKRVYHPRRPRGKTGEKMTTMRNQCQSSLSVLTL